MTLERKLGDLNEFHFLREFTFSQTTFFPKPTAQVELADNLVWLDDIFIVYQLKERGVVEVPNADTESRWFENKILGRATKQIRDTLGYLKDNDEITLSNHRAQKITLRTKKLARPHKLIVYQAHEALPIKCRMTKYHRSDSAGVMHILPLEDYKGLVETLITPFEIADYLAFREAMIEAWGDRVNSVPEQALVGQYIVNDTVHSPSLSFVSHLNSLNEETSSWDVSRVLQLFLERKTFGGKGAEYYPLISEIAKLNRGELRAFKERVLLSMEMAKKNEDVLPYRIVVPRTGCGFVFIPTASRPLRERISGLKNFTVLHKYEQRLKKCVGVIISPVGDGEKQFDFEWCYAEMEWEQEPKLDEILKLRNPFRPVRGHDIERYRPK